MERTLKACTPPFSRLSDSTTLVQAQLPRQHESSQTSPASPALSTTAFKILELPEELINHVLTYCDSQACMQLRKTCRKIARIASPLLFSVVHIYPSRRSLTSFIALATTEGFSQMVKHVIFYIQSYRVVDATDPIIDALNKAVGTLANVESIVVTTSYETSGWKSDFERNRHERRKWVISLDCLHTAIKNAAACQTLKCLKINPDCGLFWLLRPAGGYWPSKSKEVIERSFQEMGVAFANLHRLEITKLRRPRRFDIMGHVAIFIQQLKKLEELEISYASAAMFGSRECAPDNDLPAQLQHKASCLGLRQLKLALPTTPQSLTLFLEQFSACLLSLDIIGVRFADFEPGRPDDIFVAEISKRLPLCNLIKY